MEEGLCIKGQTSQGENECCYYTQTIYYPTQKQTGILYPFFLLWNKRRRAALVVARRLSHTGLIVYVYDGKRFNRNYTSKRRKPNKYTHKTDRTKKERKKVCVIIIFYLLVFLGFFFFGLSGQMIDKCKFFFLVDIPPSLSLLPSTHTHASSLLSVFFHL